jgi:hypothetical protein
MEAQQLGNQELDQRNMGNRHHFPL